MARKSWSEYIDDLEKQNADLKRQLFNSEAEGEEEEKHVKGYQIFFVVFICLLLLILLFR